MQGKTMICRTKRWGNSIGVILPRDILTEMGIGEGEEINIEVRKKENPLRKLFGAGKDNPITRKDIRQMRKEWESKYR